MQLGRYQVLKRLASGSVADVLLARASGLEGFARHVVIKRMRPELAREESFAKAFLDEARISASLNHHNIVQVHDIGEEGGSYYFAMEYVHGEDVRTLLAKVRERNEHVPLEIAVAVIMAAASGLHHAHEKTDSKGEKLGIVHRDVSPSNILVGYDGSVKLVDFGLAKAAQRSTQTLAGTIKGKASYMSPEQCKGETVDRRTDVFCLGIVLYELVTAQRLFKASTEFATMAAVVDGEIVPPSRVRADVPSALDAIIMRALARKASERYQTAEDLRAAVEAFAVGFELRTSNKALADYLTRLFGQRPEPWQTDDNRRPVTDDTMELVGAVRDASAPTKPTKPAPPPLDDDDDDGAFDDDNIETMVVPDEKAAIAAAKASIAARKPVPKTEMGEQSTLVEPPAFESESDTIADTSVDPTEPASLMAPLGTRPEAATVKNSTRGAPSQPPQPPARRTPAGGNTAQSGAAPTRSTPPGSYAAQLGAAPTRSTPASYPAQPGAAPTRSTPPGSYPAQPGAAPTRSTPPGSYPAQPGEARRDPSGVTPPRRDPSGITPPQNTTNTVRRDPSGVMPAARNTPFSQQPASGAPGYPPAGSNNPGAPGGVYPGLGTGDQATMLGVGSAGPRAFSQQAPLPPEMSLSKFAGFKTWFASYRSSILLGGGAGIVVVFTLMIVMRSSHNSTPATHSIDAGVPDATEVTPTPVDAPDAPRNAAPTKHSGKGSGSAAH